MHLLELSDAITMFLVQPRKPLLPVLRRSIALLFDDSETLRRRLPPLLLHVSALVHTHRSLQHLVCLFELEGIVVAAVEGGGAHFLRNKNTKGGCSGLVWWLFALNHPIKHPVQFVAGIVIGHRPVRPREPGIDSCGGRRADLTGLGEKSRLTVVFDVGRVAIRFDFAQNTIVFC
jgi:hypothetical protein